MPAFSPSAPLLCVLVCVSVCARALQRSDLRLAYVTHHSLYYCSCSQDPRPCSPLSAADCSCKDVPLSTLHRPQSHSSTASSHAHSPVFRARRLTVWYTSPSDTARLLNNSEVRHLTLIHCGTGGSRVTAPQMSASQEANFAVQHLERLTVVYLQRRPAQDRDRGKNMDSNADPETDRGMHKDTDRDRNSGADMDRNSEAPASASSSHQIQDIFLGRELGAAYHEQARLGIIQTSVLEWGASIKAYTVQTHIDSSGALPFPDLHLSKLPETSSIYVTFIY